MGERADKNRKRAVSLMARARKKNDTTGAWLEIAIGVELTALEIEIRAEYPGSPEDVKVLMEAAREMGDYSVTVEDILTTDGYATGVCLMEYRMKLDAALAKLKR